MSDAADSSNTKNAGLPILSGAVREKDPVCGMAVDPSKAVAKQEFRGNTYYFCSQRCAERFANEPNRFLSAPGTSGMETAQRGDSTHVSDAVRRGPSAAAVFTGKNTGALQAGAEITQTVTAKPALYTCPMHPAIVQPGPGSCPICGMALEPMEVSAVAEADPECDSMSRRLLISAALSLP